MNDRVYYFIKPYDESLPMPPQESFAQILNEAYLHPFNWKARTTRKSFWWSTLINLILGILCVILGFYAFNQSINPGIRIIDGVVAVIAYLWLFLAGLGQTIRRLHDVGYSGYWYWAAFTGYGAMFLFYPNCNHPFNAKLSGANTSLALKITPQVIKKQSLCQLLVKF